MNTNQKKILAYPLPNLDETPSLAESTDIPSETPLLLKLFCSRNEDGKTDLDRSELRNQFQAELNKKPQAANETYEKASIEDYILDAILKAETLKEETECVEYLDILMRVKSINFLEKTGSINRLQALYTTLRSALINPYLNPSYLTTCLGGWNIPSLFGFITPLCNVSHTTDTLPTFQQKQQEIFLKKICKDFPDALTSKNPLNETLLHEAAKQQNFNALIILLENLPEAQESLILEKASDNGCTFLHIAINELNRIAPKFKATAQLLIKKMIKMVIEKWPDSAESLILSTETIHQEIAFNYIQDDDFRANCCEVVKKKLGISFKSRKLEG